MTKALTPEEFGALATKAPTMLQTGLAKFISETTGKKVSAQMVATVQRFLAPYRETEHYEQVRTEWKGRHDVEAEARKAAAEARKVAALEKREVAALKVIAELAALRAGQTATPVAPAEPAKPARKTGAAKKAEKAAADKKAADEKRAAAKAALHLVPTVAVDEDEDTFVAPAITLTAPAAAPEWTDEDDETDYGVQQPEPEQSFPVVVFEDASDDDDDDDDDF